MVSTVDVHSARAANPPTPPEPPKPPPPVLPSFRAEVPVYLAVPELANMLGFAMIDNYDARMGGEPRFGSAGSRPGMGPPPCSSLTPAEAKKAMLTGRGCATPADEAELTLEHLPLGWARVFGVTGEQQPGGRPSASLSTPFLNGKGPQFSASYDGFQVGADLFGGSAYGGFDRAGLCVGYADAFAGVEQVYSAVKAGTVTLNAYSGGAYWMHVAPQGWWLDGVAQATWFEDAKGSTPNAGMSVSGSAVTVSLESGYPSRPYPNWTVEPQGQLIFQYAQMGSGADAFGVTSFADTNDRRGSRVREKDSKDPTLGDRARVTASKGGCMTIPFEKLKARLLHNPKVKAEYDALAPEFEIAAELLRARLRSGLSQADLAARMRTSQSTIARLESGQTLPSTKTLLRYAEATGSKFRVRLSAA